MLPIGGRQRFVVKMGLVKGGWSIMKNLRAAKYMDKNKILMDKFESRARSWLVKNNHKTENATFYMDGLFDSEEWFRDGNNIRPLFILKEVNQGVVEDVSRISFIGTDESQSDAWNEVMMWRRLGALARGVFDLLELGRKTDYRIFSKGSEKEAYYKTLRRIGVINLKKLPGGESAGSPKSKAYGPYEDHAKDFSDLLSDQIELINPTVIIVCCSEGDSKFVLPLLKNHNGNSIPVIEGRHPARSSNELFYYSVLGKLEELIK